MKSYLIVSLLLVVCPLRALSQLVSSTLSSGVVDHIAVSDSNVYISSDANVYRLSANLQMIGSPVSVGGNVIGMATTGDGEWLVVCTSATDGPCSALNGSTLTSTAIGNGGSDGSGSDLTVFTVPVSGGESIYTGSYGSDRIRYRQYGFDGSSLMPRTVDQTTSNVNFRGRQFISGFFTSGYAYYVVLDGRASAGTFELRIIRVCNSTADGTNNDFNNQYELILGCNSANGQYLTPSHISTSVINGATLLIGIHFEPGSGNTPSVCSFSLSNINSAMDGAFDTCVVGNSGSSNILWQSQSCSGLSGTICDISGTVPAVGVVNPLFSSNIISNMTILSGLTATLGLTIDNIDLVYLAFTDSSNHYIDKYSLNNDSLTFISEVELMSPLRNLTGSDNSNYIYGINGTIGLGNPTTGNTIFGIKIEECSSATSCGDCVSLGDPLCGWCVVERKCSRRPHCRGSAVSERFLMQGSTSCITSVSIIPPRFILDLQPMPYQVNISISTSSSQISPFPKLSGEEFFCVFNDVMVPLLVGDDSGFFCQVQPVISQLTDLQLATNFSIFSNLTGVNFLTLQPIPSPYIFYNCSSASRCSNCVDTNGVCGWCQLDFTCTGTNTSCSGSNNWLSIKNEETAADLCPFLQPSTNPDSNYTQPANVMKDLILSTVNTRDVTGLNYECVYGTNTRPATRTNDTAVTCDVSQVITLTGGNTMTQTLPFTLRQTSMGKVYPLEINTTTNTLDVILYNCPGLATGCSSCLATTFNTGFGCSWCTVSNQCREKTFCEDSNDVSVTDSSNCPLPMITDFTPKNGSSKGGTRVDITGTNLGTQLSDIISITIGSSRSCSSISTYVPGQRIVCTITDDPNGTEIGDSIRVTIRNSQSQNLTATSSGVFELLTPVIGSISPTLGPVSGGTKVIVTGMNLNIGNQEDTRVIMRERVNKRASSQCPDADCMITSIDSTEIRCTSDPTTNTTCSRTVAVSINGNDADLDNNAMVTYSYRNDPTFNGVSPPQTIPAGGINLTFTGANVDIIQSPMIAINDSRFPTSSIESCVSTSPTTLICTAPVINSPIRDSDYGQPVSYQLILDGAPSPDSNMFQLQLTLRRDPNITGVSDTITFGANEITIQGSNFMSVDQSEIMITLTDTSETYTCDIQTLSDIQIDCMAPNKPVGTTLSVQVKIGNLRFPIDGSNTVYTVTYTRAASEDLAPILGGAAGGIIVIVIVLVLCISIPVAFAIRRHSKKKDLQFNNLLSQMESMELDITDQCKQAFAELQTELGELVADDAADLHQLPFHDFPTYATKVFFPSAGVHHPVLSPPRVPSNMTKEDLSSLLEEFRTLVFDKKFLIAFVKTLESQPKFNLQEKSTMASLIMVACLNDISYATDILQTLLSDLIRRSLSNTRNHPKLLLRRTESVAEKLLTNWFCVTLYPYMLEHAGAPMYILFKAVKAQLEKGPIDVITGEARNSLSEEKLLRQALEFKVMECEVELGNASSLLAHTKKQEQPLENDSPHIETVQTIRLLDTDSISQTKEKILDFIYCNRPVSMRPSIGEVELELCRGNAGIPLKDQDTTSARDGEWMKINTLGHYNILEMSEAAVEDPKKLLPRFRLTPRLMSPIKPGMRPMSGAGYDVPGTIVASASITSQTSLLASVNQLPSFDTNTRLYHLIKSQEASDGQGQQKIVSEVFLTRLLSTKRILQSYVDNLFKAIFGIPHGKPLPKSIKVMFDFLDMQAAELGINDPEVLHTWKTNTLPLRFWVNLIKNPDFVFDINKSATVDACFTVIAQAYIDGCSTAEVRYTKDTPSARLLYANEVKQYKQEVLQFYDKVQSLPRTTNDELRSYFTEMVDTYFQNFESKEGLHFHPESALLELYRYAVSFGDEILETLTEEKLTLVASHFNSLRQKYDVSGSSM